MNLIVGKSLIGYQERMDGGPRLSVLPGNCYEKPVRRNIDKVVLPAPADPVPLVVETTEVAEQAEAQPVAVSRIQKIVNKIKQVERDLLAAYKAEKQTL